MTLLTTPGGHGYLDGGTTMPAIVDGLRAIALKADAAVGATVTGAIAAADYYQGTLTGSGGADLNATLGPPSTGNRARFSLYYIAAQPALVANMPPNPWTGFLEVYTSPNRKIFIQRMTYDRAAAETWQRYIIDGSGGWTWGPWQRVSVDPNAASDGGALAARRAMLLAAFTARRGGTIGTAGLPAIALRFDHHLDAFVSKVLPLLRERALPWAQAINPENVGTGDDNLTYTQLQAMCLADGGEVWNHGGNHLNASGTAAITAQIVGSLTALQAGMPRLTIEGWAPPGLATGGFDGYAPMQTIDQHTDTLAGRLAIGHHAAVSGYLPGLYRPLDGRVRIGQPHATIDTVTPATASGYIRGIPGGHGLVLMLHPSCLDQPGYLTTTDLAVILDEIVTRRDAGQLAVLSHTGLLVADASHDRRHDLLTVHDTTGDLTATIGLQRLTHLAGGMRELTATITRTSPGTVITTIGDSTRTHTAPSGTSLIRHPAVIPADATSITITITGATTITGARCLTI